MPAASPISTHSVGRTFAVAISLLGLVALAQLGSVSWVFFQRFQTLAAAAKPPGGKSQPQTARRTTAVTLPRALEQEEGAPAIDPMSEDVGLVANETGPIPPPPKPEPISQAKLNPPPPPPENRFQELMQQGKALRTRGDMNTALIRFREAAALEPMNAETIAEMALTYERMALLDRAAEQWKRIYDMGDVAGSLYIAAESRLKMSQVQAVAAAQLNPQVTDGPVSSLRDDAELGLGAIIREDRPDSAALLKFALRIPIRARREVKVNVQDVDIHVLFYDELDPKTIVQTGADVSYKFTSTPIDWNNGEPETLEVEYNQPVPLGKGPKQEDRKFFGYVVRVYYKGELQDTVAEPESLNAKFPAPQTLEKVTNPK